MEKILEPFLQNILRHLSAECILSIDKIQSLWSDYGAIFRLKLQGAQVSTVVVKCIVIHEKTIHPRGWASNHSHERKLKSYLIENYWYENHADSLPKSVKVPQLLYSEHTSIAQILVLEDLSIFYPKLKQSCTYQEAKNVVKWLAGFHAHFINSNAEGLWPIGSYWHLDTRPEEWQSMEEGPMKEKAEELDRTLNQAKYQTIIHGDAKVANFCFADDGQIAGLDFQYVGKGIGMKDLAYFIGSCFTSDECEHYENALLDFYFEELGLSIKELSKREVVDLEKEWRALYPIAWADFNRFLMGWLPSHQKLHTHAIAKNEEALEYLEGL